MIGYVVDVRQVRQDFRKVEQRRQYPIPVGNRVAVISNTAGFPDRRADAVTGDQVTRPDLLPFAGVFHRRYGAVVVLLDANSLCGLQHRDIVQRLEAPQQYPDDLPLLAAHAVRMSYQVGDDTEVEFGDRTGFVIPVLKVG